MIDPTHEPLIALAEAAKLVPARGGRQTSTTTLWRWIKFGKGGVQLEGVRRPDGSWLTSAAAIGRFLEAITEQTETRPPPAQQPAKRTASQRWANSVLTAAGIKW